MGVNRVGDQRMYFPENIQNEWIAGLFDFSFDIIAGKIDDITPHVGKTGFPSF